MITATFLYNEGRQITGFTVVGHAGYAQAGSDIVCAAVSALTINTINAIEKLTDSRVEAAEDEGRLWCRCPDPSGNGIQLLMSACLLGLSSIREQYGSQYITIHSRM